MLTYDEADRVLCTQEQARFAAQAVALLTADLYRRGHISAATVRELRTALLPWEHASRSSKNTANRKDCEFVDRALPKA